MGFFDYFPYTNFHELNLNWLLAKIKCLHEKYLLQEATLEQIQEEIKNLNVPEIVKEQINDMIQSGELTDLFTPLWKDLYTKNKMFYLGDLYIISETPVNTLPLIGSKFAHYNNIIFTWDDQLLQLKNTINNLATNSSASVVFIFINTKTPYNTFHNFQEIAASYRNKFPNAEIFIAGGHNYDYGNNSNLHMCNKLIGSPTSNVALADNIQKILLGIGTYFSTIPYIMDPESRLSGSSSEQNATPAVLTYPSNITNNNGRLFSERWTWRGALTGTIKFNTEIIGVRTSGTLSGPDRVAVYTGNREGTFIIEQVGTGTGNMYGNITALL